jgi:hypothetical protein
MKPSNAFRRPFVFLLPVLALVLSVGPVHAEVTRTLRGEIPASGRVAVENLAGTMRITQGSGSVITVVATLHAENDEAAGLVRLEQVSGKEGVPTLRVIYPTEKYGTIRYPGDRDDSFLSRLFGGSSTTRTEYGGKRVRVSSGDGTLLYAEVEVQVPVGADVRFLNSVGPIRGESLDGTLGFDTGSGNVVLQTITGQVTANTGSGNVEATAVQGTFSGSTGSGNVTLTGFEGDSVKADTGSGNIRLSDAKALHVKTSTGSGNIKVAGGGIEDFNGSTGSGNVELDTDGDQLRKLDASTGSGNVVLRLGAGASFDARTETGSGRIVSRYDDAEPIMEDKEIVGYRRGSLKSHVKVSTGSGNIVLEPGA